MEPRFFSGVCVPFFPPFFRWAIFPLVQFPPSSLPYLIYLLRRWELGGRPEKKERKKKEKEKKGPWSTWQIASLNRGVNHRGAHTLTQWRGLIHNTTHTHTKRERETTAAAAVPNRRRRQSNIRFQSPPTIALPPRIPRRKNTERERNLECSFFPLSKKKNSSTISTHALRACYSLYILRAVCIEDIVAYTRH